MTGRGGWFVWTDWLIRLVLGGVFIYSGAIKIADPAAFALAIENYQLLPAGLIDPLAYWLPWLELVCGAGLIVGPFKRGAAVLISGQLLVFVAALAFNIWRGLDVDCGCFGSGGATTHPTLAIWRDLAFLCLAVASLVTSFARKGRK